MCRLVSSPLELESWRHLQQSCRCWSRKTPPSPREVPFPLMVVIKLRWWSDPVEMETEMMMVSGGALVVELLNVSAGSEMAT
ncbi:Protein kinase domain-containing protein [Psidium guajava]|nr:Protein kinase domain-containing protein [Psidium guajava]